MAVRAVQACGGGEHTHGVHELVDGNALQNLNVLEDFFRHRWPLRLSRLPGCDYSAEQARRHCSDNTKNPSPRSKRHTVSLLLLLRSFVFFPAAAQNTDHAVISLVARILIKLTATLPPGDRDCPGPGPGCRIIECNFVIECVRFETRDALDHVQVAGGASEICFVAEIRRIDHERVAFPVSARVTHPLPDTRVEVRPRI